MSEAFDQSDWLQKNMKSKAFQTIQSVLFLSVGIFLMYWAFKDKDLYAIRNSISEANFYYVLPIFFFSMLGLIARAYRWKMLLRPFDKQLALSPLYHSMMFGYFVNYALPRIGELIRCYTLQQKTTISAPKAFGTVMVERLVDLAMLALLVGIVLLTNYTAFGFFFQTHIFTPLATVYETNKILFWLGVLGLLILMFWLGREGEKSEGTENKLDKLITDVYSGLTKAHSDLSWVQFLSITVLIWLCYFFTSYLWLLAIEETSTISPIDALVIMLVGSMAKSLPIQGGGMGAYHILVAGLLGTWMISEASSNAYAILNHGIQMLIHIVFGGISGLFLLRKSKVNLESSASESTNLNLHS